MIPGQISRISESVLPATATLRPRTDLTFVGGPTPITRIIPPLGVNFSQLVIIIANNQPLNFGTGGNIATPLVLPTNTICSCVFSKLTGYWYINPGQAPV